MVLFLSISFTSCTPTSLSENVTEQTTGECCDEEGDIDPPPPPPPPPGDGD